ncbi:hornerin-like isoform X3 [Varroa jacobsoni]|uniref:hornerin-like isoform X3 n=1 Tax=Varroa jacobsoni TaxID=62625 RepID=UPI000BF45D2A|nr:hornerin-like isoform X3 [Varroa jacobsoni]XP_022691526.1 hornerin-like isoform X3 [Varroa jacobsoni]XP_022691527.1 hornerin-like isoform X3 [Varroa jacobsoni]
MTTAIVRHISTSSPMTMASEVAHIQASAMHTGNSGGGGGSGGGSKCATGGGVSGGPPSVNGGGGSSGAGGGGSGGGGGGGSSSTGKLRRSASAANASKIQQRGRPSIEIYRPPGVRLDASNISKILPQAAAATLTQSYVDAVTAYLADQVAAVSASGGAGGGGGGGGDQGSHIHHGVATTGGHYPSPHGASVAVGAVTVGAPTVTAHNSHGSHNSHNGHSGSTGKTVHFSPSKSGGSANSLKRSKSFAAQSSQNGSSSSSGSHGGGHYGGGGGSCGGSGGGNSHSNHHGGSQGSAAQQLQQQQTQLQQQLSQAIQAQDENGHSSAALNDPLVKKALNDPNLLNIMQIMEVVRTICSKATEGIQHAGPSAQLCLSIIEKEKGDTFLESLLNSCREWYTERDKLLRSPQEGSAVSKRWTAYVTFVAELYYRLRPQRLITPRAVTLCTLLYDCLELLLKPASLKNPTELECLRTVLSVVGKQIDTDAPLRMNNLVVQMRESFLGPISANNQQMRKSILEMIELRASSWTFDLQQSMYYFPYTNQLTRLPPRV